MAINTHVLETTREIVTRYAMSTSDVKKIWKIYQRLCKMDQYLAFLGSVKE